MIKPNQMVYIANAYAAEAEEVDKQISQQP
jgi:hypothetical protein